MKRNQHSTNRVFILYLLLFLVITILEHILYYISIIKLNALFSHGLLIDIFIITGLACSFIPAGIIILYFCKIRMIDIKIKFWYYIAILLTTIYSAIPPITILFSFGSAFR